MIVMYIMAGLMVAPSGSGFSSHHIRQVQSLCHRDEQTLFECRVDKKVASLCLPSGSTKFRRKVTYRFGTPTRVEFVYPRPNSRATPSLFKLSAQSYTGGRETHIRFTNGHVEYQMYHAYEGGCCDRAGHRENSEEAGILIKKSGRLVADLKCDDPSQSSIMEESLPQENFVPRR